MKRINIIGLSGAGKTSLAAEISTRLGIPHIEMDRIFWLRDWKQRPPSEFEARVGKFAAGDSWVMDGNYNRVRSIIWQRVETVVWLDYSLLRCLWQVVRRTFRRVFTRELLWGRNRESLRSAVLSRHSLLFFVIRTHHYKRKLNEESIAKPEYAHIHFVRLKSPAQTRRWLEEISSKG